MHAYKNDEIGRCFRAKLGCVGLTKGLGCVVLTKGFGEHKCTTHPSFAYVLLFISHLQQSKFYRNDEVSRCFIVHQPFTAI